MTYRNRALLDLADGAPCSAPGCGCRDGTVVACHANLIEYAKGTGIKAHDWAIAVLCGRCHYELDNGRSMTKAEKYEFFHRAALRTFGWLLETGKLKVAP